MQKKQPVRMCSGCAAHRPKRELVRVVRTPEGTILLDPGGKKSGRGAYLCPDAACLKKARKARRLEFSAISLCRKARRLRMGADVVRDNVLSGEAKLVLLTSDIAERSARHARGICGPAHVPVRTLPYTMQELAPVAGKHYGVFAVCDRGFADMILGLLPDGTA